MADILSIYNSINFIEENLKESVTVMDIAASSGYSLFHFSRTFNAVTRHNPYDYLMRRRLSEAAKIIVKDVENLTDIAFEFQFNSLETFSRAFKRMFGIAPIKYKTEQHLSSTSLKKMFSLDYLLHINNNSFFRPTLRDISKMHLIGKLEYLCVKSSQPHSMDSKYCILSFGTGNENSASDHFLFKQVDSLEQIPDNAVAKTIPALKCVQFTHFAGDLRQTYDYIFQTWLPLSVYTTCMPYSIELLNRKASIEISENLPLEILIPIEKLKDSKSQKFAHLLSTYGNTYFFYMGSQDCLLSNERPCFGFNSLSELFSTKAVIFKVPSPC